MSDNATYSVELKEGQYAWLEQMAEQYDLPDVSKVMRCLINHAIDRTDTHATIFEEIRCYDC